MRFSVESMGLMVVQRWGRVFELFADTGQGD